MSNDNTAAAEFRTLPGLVAAAAAQRPAHPALTEGARTLDYAGLNSMMNRVAAALQRDGLGPGAVIAICAANSIEYASVFLGALRAGVAVAPLAPSSTAASLAMMVASRGATSSWPGIM